MSVSEISFIAELEQIVRDRLASGAGDSYTAQLAAAGTLRIAQKVGEEALEVALAAAAGEREQIVDETADLVYHLIVLLNERGIGLGEVAARLRSRHRPD